MIIFIFLRCIKITKFSPLVALLKEKYKHFKSFIPPAKDLSVRKLKNTVQYENFSKACPEKEKVANNTLASTGYLDSGVMLERWKMEDT